MAPDTLHLQKRVTLSAPHFSAIRISFWLKSEEIYLKSLLVLSGAHFGSNLRPLFHHLSATHFSAICDSFWLESETQRLIM
ncbi:MAG: hypothetical protein JWN75_1084 [Candidatus Saccharibacteria bacterium]|nr:hypothetical protein [Candidatus Saccharibacteria bacterium]